LIAICALPAAVRADIGTNYGNWSNYGTWGYCYTATFGQSLRGNGEVCTGFRFRFYNGSCCSDWPFRAILMRWDSAQSRAVGPVLAQVDSTFGNQGCCWFDREVTFPTAVGLNADSDYIVFFTLTPWWGNYGCPNANFAITPDQAYSSGRMFVLSNGSSASDWTQSTWSATGYDIEFVVRTTNDCNGNGIVDVDDIASGAALDCNANGIADSCEQLPAASSSLVGSEQGPIGSTASVPFAFDRVLPAAGNVQLRIDALGDLSATHEFLLVAVGGGAARPVFTTAATDCSWLTETITLTAAEFNAAIKSNSLAITVSASPTVDAAACSGGSLVRLQLDYTEAFPDCNDNLVADSEDFCSGFSVDCNGNRRPDECDISLGASNDVDRDGVPDECQPDCNNDGRPDAFQILVGEESDCNANALPDECDLYSGGVSVDCNGNGVPDECDIASGTAPDCDGDGKIDSCALSQGLVPDCNGNGVPDSCDIASGASQDCNGNLLPDSCEVAALGYIDFYSPQQALSVAQPFTFAYAGARPSAADVYMEVNYYLYADYGYNRPARVLLDGIEVYTWADNHWGCCCSNNRGFYVNRDVWNQIASDGFIECRVVTQSDCSGAYARLRFIYTRLPLATDCNSNGIPDACDITSGFDHDCNGNGQLDACDITQGAEDDNLNGYPDPCELDRGDLNLDGEVDGSDLAILLSYWGGVGFPIGDCNRDGIIAGADLAILLGNWGDPL
jgi:hypothetical protein